MSDDDIKAYAAWVAYCAANTGNLDEAEETRRAVLQALQYNPLDARTMAMGRRYLRGDEKP